MAKRNWEKSYESYVKYYTQQVNKGIAMDTRLLSPDAYKNAVEYAEKHPPKYSNNRYNSFKKSMPRFIAQEQRQFSSGQVDRLRKAIKGGQSLLRSKIASGEGVSEAEKGFLNINTGTGFLNQNYMDLWAVIQVVFPVDFDAVGFYYTD